MLQLGPTLCVAFSPVTAGAMDLDGFLSYGLVEHGMAGAGGGRGPPCAPAASTLVPAAHTPGGTARDPCCAARVRPLPPRVRVTSSRAPTCVRPAPLAPRAMYAGAVTAAPGTPLTLRPYRTGRPAASTRGRRAGAAQGAGRGCRAARPSAAAPPPGREHARSAAAMGPRRARRGRRRAGLAAMWRAAACRAARARPQHHRQGAQAVRPSAPWPAGPRRRAGAAASAAAPRHTGAPGTAHGRYGPWRGSGPNSRDTDHSATQRPTSHPSNRAKPNPFPPARRPRAALAPARTGMEF
jgi:hypothetical protein